MPNSEGYEEYNPSDVYALEANKDVEGLIDIVEHGKKKNVVKKAILALGGLKDVKALETVIYKALLSEGTIRSASIWALGTIGDKRAIQPLIKLLENENEDENQHTREEVIEALGKIGTEEAISRIISTLDTSLSEKATLILKEIGHPVIASLISALNSNNQTVREKTVTILGEMGDKEATEPLIAVFEDATTNSDLKEQIILALGNIKDDRAIGPLIAVLEGDNESTVPGDADYSIKCWAVIALGHIGDNRVVKLLLNLLHDKNNALRIRGHVAWALGKIGDDTTVESLIRILEDHREEGFVKYNTAWALLQLDEDKAAFPVLKYLRNNPQNVTIFEPLEYSQ